MVRKKAEQDKRDTEAITDAVVKGEFTFDPEPDPDDPDQALLFADVSQEAKDFITKLLEKDTKKRPSAE